MSYRLVYTQLKSGAILGELPVSGIDYTKTLDAPGSFSATIALDYAAQCGITASDLDPGRTGIVIERDGVCLWGGILWTVEQDVRSNSVKLAGEGYLSYFRHRFIKEDLTFVQTEQVDIAAALIDYAQSVPGGSLGIVTDVTPTGKLRDRNYLAADRKEIAEALQQLGSVQDGFHFDFHCDRLSTGYVIRYTNTGPETGRWTDVIFKLGDNVESLSATIDGTTMTNSAEVRGEGAGDVTLTQTVTNTDVLVTTPLLETVDSFSDVSYLTTLGEKASHRLALGINPTLIPSLSTDPNGDPPLGSYFVGDRVRVIGSYGLLDIDDDFVITSLSVKVGASSESVDLTLAPVEAFTNV